MACDLTAGNLTACDIPGCDNTLDHNASALANIL